MESEWTTSKIFKNLSEKNYINPCCIGCDEILKAIKDEIADEMRIGKNQIEIYQEDWGWSLEFAKENTNYFLQISNYNDPKIGKTTFGVNTKAIKKEKRLFFNKTINAEIELAVFTDIVSKIAKSKGFEIN